MSAFNIVEMFSTPDASVVEIDGRNYPAPAVLEDEDGIRLLLIDGEDGGAIPAGVWTRAHASGVAYIVAWLGWGQLVTTTERFMTYRVEHPNQGSYHCALGYWSSAYKDVPRYRDLLPDEPVVASRGEFIHLHTHSEFSALDGLSSLKEIVSAVVADGGHAVAITDHGNCASHPELQKVCDDAGIKPIFGMEAYLVPDRFRRGKSWEEEDEKGNKIKKSDGKEAMYEYTHICLWAMDEEGLRNLWSMSTEAYVDGLYGKYPRLDYDTLARLNKGVMASTGCLRGPLAVPLMKGDTEKAVENLGRLYDIFGDRLYVEIHTNQLVEQIDVNKKLMAMCRDYDIKPIAAVDSHYARCEDKHIHRAWLAMQTGGDITQESSLFAGGQDYHMKTAAEVRAALAYLGEDFAEECLANTVIAADRCTARISGAITTPTFSKASVDHPDPVQRDKELLIDRCMENWTKVSGKSNSDDVYLARLEKEMKLIINSQFCGYFLVVDDYVAAAKAAGILVGPGRGSGGGSLVAYLCGIVEIDPVDADLLFERFLSEGRTELPDFDIDFPASARPWLKGYVRQRWGDDHVITIGTIGRLQSAGAINDSVKVLKTSLPYEISYAAIEGLKKTIKAADAPLAGKHMPWDEFKVEFADVVDPLVKAYPDVFEMVEAVLGRVKSYGKHAAGVVISTDRPLTDLPLRLGEDGEMVSQFDMKALALMGYIKFDLLTLRTLDTIQGVIDLIKARTGRVINVYEWREEYLDPQVWDEVSAGRTIGLFQVETKAGTRLTKRFKPRSPHDLAAVMTLVRPGPSRSGLTETYLRRREGIEPVSYAEPRLGAVLKDTFGTIIYQEDLMQTCIVLGGYTGAEADKVRSILGKKKVEEIGPAGQMFIERAVANHTDPRVAETLWEAMAEFAKYCVSGDTMVKLAASGRHSDGTITAEELYRRINAPLLPPTAGRTRTAYSGPCVICGTTTAKKWRRGACNACYVWRQKFQDVNRGLYGLTMEADERVRPARILMVHKHDPAQVWTITLADGKSITATANHRHLTDLGLRRVDELATGDRLMVDAGYEPVAPEESRRLMRTTNGDRSGVGAINGAFANENHGYIDGGFTSLMAWTAQASERCEECGHDGSEHRLERAHLDGDHTNNDWSNLRMLCVSCHKKHDYAFNARRRRWGKGHSTVAVEIVSIVPRGIEPVYSVVMDDPHLWVANGVITQNSFNKAHAFGYAILGVWTAWFKFHYPIEFLTSALSTVDADRLPEFVHEARRMGYKILPPDINESRVSFTPADTYVHYGLSAIKGLGAETAAQIVAGQPYTSLEDFVERQMKPGSKSKVDSGHLKVLVSVGAFDSLIPNRRAVELQLEAESSGAAKTCVFMDLTAKGPNDLPCVFDWANEPNPPMETKGRGAAKVSTPKAPPKKCTIACRQYHKPEPISIENVPPYTDEDIRLREKELLGVWLSSSPFDRVPPETLEQSHSVEEIEAGPNGQYNVIAVVEGVNERTSKTGSKYAFIKFNVQGEMLDATCWSEVLERHRKSLKPDQLVVALVTKNDRGVNVTDLVAT